MGRSSTKLAKLISIWLHLFHICHVCSQLAISHSAVKFLPGFEGPLPFQLETGYVGVGESEDVQLFYYFVKSDSNPKEDPLVLWLTGGPGCTVFSGFIYEIGPLNFKQVQYNGSLPTLVLNPNSWTKVANIIFVDQPVGTGFSYAKTESASQTSDLQTCDHVYQFLRKEMKQGYLLGNPLTDMVNEEDNYQIPFAHGMGLISDELYESLKTSCRGQYKNVDPSNAICLHYVQVFDQCTSGIDFAHILEPLCGYASPKPHEILFGKRRFLEEKMIKELQSPQTSLSAFSCRIDGYRLCYPWITDARVQEALHVRKGTTTGTWQRCNDGLPYRITVMDSFPFHVNLSIKGYRSLIYSGDHDMMVPFLATQAWIRSLNYSIVDDWRPWTVQDQVGGEEGTQLQSTNLKNVLPCLKGGYLRSLCKLKDNTHRTLFFFSAQDTILL